jgi:hypothetical protein
MGLVMTNVTKILLSLLVAAMVSPAKVSVAQAISITNYSYEVESLDRAASGSRLGTYYVMINGLDNGLESLSITGKPADCDYDHRGCGATEAPASGNGADATSAGKARVSTSSTSVDATENSEPTALLLMILGLIGLSRLRGRPID